MGSIPKGRKNTYNVRNFQEFETERKRTVYFGLETLVAYLRNYGLSCHNK